MSALIKYLFAAVVGFSVLAKGAVDISEMPVTNSVSEEGEGQYAASAFIEKLSGNEATGSGSSSLKILSELIDMDKLEEAFANSDPEALKMLWAVLQEDNATINISDFPEASNSESERDL